MSSYVEDASHMQNKESSTSEQSNFGSLQLTNLLF